MVLDGHTVGDAVGDLPRRVVLADEVLGDLHAHHLEMPVVALLFARLDARQPLVEPAEIADHGPDLVGIRLDVDINLCHAHTGSIAQASAEGEGRDRVLGGDEQLAAGRRQGDESRCRRADLCGEPLLA